MIAVVLLAVGLLGVFGAAAPAASADGIVASVVTTVLGIPAFVRAKIDPEGSRA